jgi:hypothetical protein
MKTLTEFSGFVLKDVLAKKTAWLAEGKSDEEVQTAINEQLKLDETKVSFYKNAIDMTSSRLDRVKRVVVAVRATETEKVPEAFTEREGHFYLIEFFPQAGAAPALRDSNRDFGRDSRGRGGRGGSDRGSSGRGGNDSGRGNGRPSDRDSNRSDRFPSRNSETATAKPAGLFAARTTPIPGTEKPVRPARPPRSPSDRAQRSPRPPRAVQGPRGAGELRLVLKGQSTTLQGSAVQAEVPAEVGASVETAQSPSTN